MKKLVAVAFVVYVAMANAEQYRLKMPATVDVVEGDVVTGTKKLKAGTLLKLSDEADSSSTKDKMGKVPVKTAGVLVPSKLSPIMFKNTQPASAVFCAKIKMGDSYYGPFAGKDKTHWAVVIYAYNEDWEDEETFYACASRSAKSSKKIVDVIKDGKEHDCHVKVKPVKYEDEKDYVQIEDFEIVSGRNVSEMID